MLVVTSSRWVVNKPRTIPRQLLLPTIRFFIGRVVGSAGIGAADLCWRWCHLLRHQLEIVQRIERGLFLRFFVGRAAAANDGYRGERHGQKTLVSTRMRLFLNVHVGGVELLLHRYLPQQFEVI